VAKFPVAGNKEDGARLSSVVPNDRTRGNRHKLNSRKLNIKNPTFFYCECGQTVAEIAQMVVDSPSLESWTTCCCCTCFEPGS